MIFFNNDYNEVAHPAVMKKLAKYADVQMPGYSMDESCKKAADYIRKACNNDNVAVHFLVGGTQTNLTVIAAALRPHQAVIGAESAHINVHETGSIEATGHKVIGLASDDGKITAAQIEENVLSPATPILDEKINFSGYSPKNYDGKYHGYVSTRYALAKSLNVPAVKTLNSLGLEKALNYANKLHLPLETNDLSLSLALGGITKGFTLNELLGGYSTLANNGQFCSLAYIKKIIIDNAVIYERKEEKTQVFSPSTAYLLTDMLKTCVKEGTAKKLSALPFELGAKTGTNGTAKTNLDAYAFSYTTLDSVGVWLGNKDNSPINHTGGSLPCNISFDVHQWLKNDYDEKGISIPNFFIPDSVKKIAIDKYAYENDNTVLLADSLAPEEYRIYELFNTNFLPQKQATTFSNPTLATPSIQVNNDTAIITFDVNTPIFYRILVEKYYYAK